MNLTMKVQQFSSHSILIMPKQLSIIFIKLVFWAVSELYAMIPSKHLVLGEGIMNLIWIFEEHLSQKTSFGRK